MRSDQKKATARKMPSGNPIYRGWPSAKRYKEAARLHLTEGWSIRSAALELGVSRSRFNMWKNDPENERLLARIVTDAENEKLAEKVGAASVSPLGLAEKRRTGTIHEFVDRYFSWQVCSDCDEHHETPKHVSEMFDLLQDPTCRRGVVNVPPFHSKTDTSIKDTVYDICTDPNSSTMIVSKSSKFAWTILHSIVELLTNEELYGQGPNLIKDWGPFQDGSTNWTQSQIYVAGRMSMEKDPTVIAMGVGQQVYGRRAKKIKADDVATLDNQRNPSRVLDMLEWFDKELLSRPGLKSGRMYWLGTRVFPGDIYEPLSMRNGYRVVKYPCIIDEVDQVTLWPEHFPYDLADMRRSEMRDDHWQLIYQQVAMPGQSASFTVDAINNCKDTQRTIGHFDPRWRLVAGLDLAGGSAGSGYTAGVLLGIDIQTGNRYLVDVFHEKSFRAPLLKEKIFEWTDQYPIYLWKVESNALQQQIIQYNTEITNHLASHGSRVEGHQTTGKKWDPEFGVESMSPLFNAGMFNLPWGGGPRTSQKVQPLIEELLQFPLGATSDLVMAAWMAEIGCRQLLRRGHLPMFSNRAKSGRHGRLIVDFATQEIQQIGASVHEAPGGALSGRYQRLLSGRVGGYRRPVQVLQDPMEQRELTEQGFVNVEGSHIAADPDKE